MLVLRSQSFLSQSQLESAPHTRNNLDMVGCSSPISQEALPLAHLVLSLDVGIHLPVYLFLRIVELPWNSRRLLPRGFAASQGIPCFRSVRDLATERERQKQEEKEDAKKTPADWAREIFGE